MPKQTASAYDRGAPDAGEILGLYQMRLNEGDEAKLRSRARTARTLTEMEHQVSIPSEYRAIAKEIRTPFIRDTWLRVAAALTRDTPVSHVEPRDITEAAREAANIAERVFLATLFGIERETGEPLIFADAKALVRDQESVIKFVHKSDAWASFPKKETGEKPEAFDKRVLAYKKGAGMVFSARVVDRLSMLFGDGEYGDEWALEYGEYPTSYLKRRYKMAVEDGDGSGRYYEDSDRGERVYRNRRRLVNPNEDPTPENMLGGRPAAEGDLATSSGGLSTKVEYWDADWWCVVVDGSMAPGFPKRNPYAPRLPYFRAKSDPVLYALSFLVPGFDSLLTMWLNWAYIGAYATPQLISNDASGVPNIGDVGAEMEPSGGDSDRPVVTWKVGKAMEPPPGYHWEFIQPPPIGQDVQQMAQVYRQLIETAGVASVLRGNAGSDFSGYLANQLIAAATLTYKNLGTAIERQLADMGEFMWHVVRTRIKQEVYVLATEMDGKKEKKTWLGLKPDGTMSGMCAPIDMLARMEVKLRPVLPTDEQARAMIATQLTNAQKPLDSRRHAMEYWLQFEDPEGIINEIAVEDALDNDPMLKQLTITAALQKAGILPPEQSGLLGPNGSPLPSSGQNPNMTPYFPGQISGMPGIPGLTQPMIPPAPQPAGVPGANGGRPAGAMPGQPGNQGPPSLV